MTVLTWDGTGQKIYETGVDHGVLYMPNESGVYDNGVAWNGLVTVTESPTGAEANKTYADNIVYRNLISAEEFGATIEAYTYPEEFGDYDGTSSPTPGIVIGQQFRKTFGLSYRTLKGNDVEGNEFGYKIHLVYGLTAAPSEKAYSTVNDSPEMITFSWELTSLPVNATDYRPTSVITVDSTQVDEAHLQTLEDLLYGTVGGDPQLPTPDQVVAIFTTGLTTVDTGTAANQPTYNAGTHVVTLPAVTGIQWKINGADVSSGAQPALTTGQTAEVEATPQTGYIISGDSDWTYDF